MCSMRSISSMCSAVCGIGMCCAIGSRGGMRSFRSGTMTFGGSAMFAMGSSFFVLKTVPIVFCGAFVP